MSTCELIIASLSAAICGFAFTYWASGGGRYR